MSTCFELPRGSEAADGSFDTARVALQLQLWLTTNNLKERELLNKLKITVEAESASGISSLLELALTELRRESRMLVEFDSSMAVVVY